MRRWEIVVLGVLVVFFGVGLAGHLVGSFRGLMIRLTPLALLMTTAAAIVPLAAERSTSTLVWLAASFVVGFAVEAVGVATGAIFGSYTYGTVLGPRLLAVPLIIGLNWAVVVLGAAALAGRLTGSPLVTAAVTGLVTVGFDWLLEPVAMALGYWSWADGVIPLRNYVAWFVVSAVLSLAWGFARLKVKSWLPTAALAVQIAFFSLLRLGL